ncbi:tyrosine-type recombinase/integrase [Variovorax dokdonensis]|uniref:Tyrosine-type recombinase/integrase n=1 Tax=Variovorax dokdonensis TaxID=344883 RepID=A0ABT7NCM1_9BURK|nr:tyrosine-type recombinase/integrase [Variovorax dokdonensis]MDM0045694.1 tyrosine-type recombinase/integrase [Variovorax dokdonensis]
MNVKPMGKRFQLRVVNKLLPKPYYDTFDTEAEARAYGEQLERLLKNGIVPRELAAAAPKAANPTVLEVINAFEGAGHSNSMDKQLLDATTGDILGLKVNDLTAPWVDQFIHKLKFVNNNAPGTIRKKVGLYGRILDWHHRQTTDIDKQPPANPFRGLKRGYSVYTRDDTKKLAALPIKPGEKAKRAKKDVQRDRRMLPAEYERVKLSLQGKKFEGQPWHRAADPELEMFVELILDTGMRQREAYRVHTDHLHLDRGFMQVMGSKGRHGEVKPRTVPLKPSLVELLRTYTESKTGLLFHWWDGTPEGLDSATDALGQVFRRLFTYAKVPDFKEHDLRHEACCRWFELRKPDGSWMFSDVEICRIMGWSDYSMVLRYASIRGEDLASRLHA